MMNELIGLESIDKLPNKLEFQGNTWVLTDMRQECNEGVPLTLDLKYMAIKKPGDQENAT